MASEGGRVRTGESGDFLYKIQITGVNLKLSPPERRNAGIRVTALPVGGLVDSPESMRDTTMRLLDSKKGRRYKTSVAALETFASNNDAAGTLSNPRALSTRSTPESDSVGGSAAGGGGGGGCHCQQCHCQRQCQCQCSGTQALAVPQWPRRRGPDALPQCHCCQWQWQWLPECPECHCSGTSERHISTAAAPRTAWA